MVFELSNTLSNNPLGGNLQRITIEAMTVRELGDAAAGAGVLPSTLLAGPEPQCAPLESSD
jgi:hypothetical protein